jgi:hypothetical protein
MSPKKWSEMTPSGISYFINGNNYNIQWDHTNENQNESTPGSPTDWEDLELDSNFGYDDYYYTINVLIKDINDNILFNWQNIDLGKASQIQSINGKMTYQINIEKEGIYQINVNARISSESDSEPSAYSENIFITYPPAPTVATCCFTKDAKLETDQGLIELYKVDSKVHTVNNKRIKGVSKCIFSMDKIIVIEKDAFEKDKPSKKTIVSPFHVFIINNEEKVICDCIDKKKIYLERYNTDDILYNPILENEEDIKINNMLVKSLTHNCLLARMYDGSSSQEQIKKIGNFLNDYHRKLKNKPNKSILDYRI